MVPGEYTNNAYAKFRGTTKSIMVFFRTRLFNRDRVYWTCMIQSRHVAPGFIPFSTSNTDIYIHLFQKTLPERTVNGSCTTEIARPNGTVVSIFGMQKKEFFTWRKTDTAVRKADWLRLNTTVHRNFEI